MCSSDDHEREKHVLPSKAFAFLACSVEFARQSFDFHPFLVCLVLQFTTFLAELRLITREYFLHVVQLLSR